MTEIDKLKRAQMYIEKLSKGINPLDNSYVEPDDVVKNERISRCLSYVSDVLSKVIENESTGELRYSSPRKATKEEFEFPVEMREKFVYSKTPVTVSEINRQINLITDDCNMKKLSSSAVFDWLTESGILEMITDSNGKNTRKITAQGKNMGVFYEHRTGQSGSYTVILYNEEMQRFIIDNIDAIIEINNSRHSQTKIDRNDRKGWTKAQDIYLKDLFEREVTVSEMSETLIHSEGAIIQRLIYLGLIEEKQ